MPPWTDVVDAAGTAVLVLLTGVLYWIEHRRGRAVLHLRETSSHQHHDRHMGAKSPGRAIWFLLVNLGGTACEVDSGRSYLLLERRAARAKGDPRWIGRLPRFWADRLRLRRRRPSRLATLWAEVRPWRWEIVPIAVWDQNRWSRTDFMRQHAGEDLPEWMQDDDGGVLGSASARAYVAEYSLTRSGPMWRRAILVIKPFVGSAASMRLTVHDEHGEKPKPA